MFRIVPLFLRLIQSRRFRIGNFTHRVRGRLLEVLVPSAQLASLVRTHYGSYSSQFGYDDS